MTSLSSPTTTGFKPLQQAFASYLRETNLYPGLTHVECSERGGRLLLLAEHRAPEVGQPNDLLKELEAAFRELVPTVGLPEANWAAADVLSARIYLKLKTAAQPYAFHTFTWQPEDAIQVVFPDVSVPAPGSRDGLAPELVHGSASGSPEESAGEGANDSTDDSVEPIKSVDPMADPMAELPAEAAPAAALVDPAAVDHALAGLEDAGVTAYGASSGTNSQELGFSDAALARPDAAVQSPDGRGPWSQVWAGQGLRSLRYYWSYGLATLILVGSGAFAYALSRPCVVGSCDRIDHAAEFSNEAQATLADSPNGEDLATAQLDLQNAIDLLTPVPTWSPHYEAAQADLQQYQESITALNAVIQGQAIATEAANLSQNPPHPVEVWVNVHLLWQQAIDWLASVPADSPAYDYSQKKLHEYRGNYSAIGHRIVAEEEAEANFNTAIQTGNLAQQRMETANSLAGWQLATKEWQAAIKGLSLIPQGTMVYDEAQAQLSDYRQQLNQVSNRATLEEAGARNYHLAVQAARSAAAFEAQGQWTLALAQWQTAVASARQIPTDTILADEGAVLLETYQPALDNAQSHLRNAVALQTLTTKLAQLCEYSATPCTVREDPSQIQVILSSQYAEPLRQAITPPAADGTFAFTTQLSPSAQQLIDQIIATSHQIDRQVAVYDSHGGFVARYRPDLGGFIKN